MGKSLRDAKAALFRKLRREVGNERVMRAMEQTHREMFVPPDHRSAAYEDAPLPIGQGQTISQPFIVALMTAALRLSPTDTVLEVGTGSGYQAAILSHLVPRGRVVTVERIHTLARRAEGLLRSLQIHNVQVLAAGPDLGCPEQAPYDAIIVTAAAPKLPQSLLDQLAVGGRIIIPVGGAEEQELVWAMRTGEGVSFSFDKGPCRFVPLIGREAWPGPPA